MMVCDMTRPLPTIRGKQRHLWIVDKEKHQQDNACYRFCFATTVDFKCYQKRDNNGSWENSVVMTYLQLQLLMEMGLTIEDECVSEGADWLLTQFRESLEIQKAEGRRRVVVQNMFASDDLQTDFLYATQEIPELNPVRDCYMSLPFIQTALALYTLVHLGFEDNEKIVRAYETVLDLRLTAEDGEYGTHKEPWCAINCFSVIARAF